MKNIIIICGLPGTGKTTLSKKISEKFGYKYINDWEILQSCDREQYKEDRIAISNNLSKQIDEYILANQKQQLVIDLDYSALPEDFNNFKSKDLCDIIFLGFGNVSEEELYYVMNKKDDSLNLREKVKYFIEISKYCERECESFKYRFYSIDKSRENTLKEVLNNL